MSGPILPARVCLAADLFAGGLRVGRSECARRGLRHEAVLDLAVEDPAPVKAKVAKLEARGGCVWAAALPIHESLTRWLKAPLASEAKARRVLPSLLDIQLPFSIEECVHLFPWIRPSGRGEVEALAVAARTSDLRRRLESLAALGISPVVLDHEGLALWSQSLREEPPRGGGWRVVAALYPDHLALVLGQTDGREPGESRFAGAHSLRPVEALWQGAGNASAEPAVQRVIGRVRQILQAQAASSSIEWLWTGPGAADAALTEDLQHHLGALGSFAFHSHARPESFLVRALATRALRGGAWPCNFRIGSLAHPTVERHLVRRSRGASAALAAAGLVLCGLGLAWPSVLEARKNGVQSELESLAGRLAPGLRLPYGQELRSVRQALQDRAALYRPFLDAFEPSAAELLLEVLQTARAAGLTLDSLGFSGDSVTARGAGADWDRCEQLAGPFRARGLRVVLERQDAGLDEKVHFTLKGGNAP
ncbi:MAG TPA: hypothetical protein P5567_13495 [Kiritimatiellia bacterium]|nr:hypothetical protein [Kiritimatiellia bacterium]HRZ13457.1 hypothetical protein [Kiritimatiellia bacterium]HSA19665.1 hypothetical protein [Kiritimatiellia bacterium]